MKKKIIKFVVLTITAVVVIYIGVMYLLAAIVGSIFGNLCSVEKLESVTSPNNEYKVITYRKNCGATTGFSVIGELCTKDNCTEIYDCYHEQDSFVYWIDDQTISINNKILKINKDIYSWKNDENYQEHLYKK